MPFVPITEKKSLFTPIQEPPQDTLTAWQGGELPDPTPEQAVTIEMAKQASRMDPKAYVKGAGQAIGDFVGQVAGAGKEIGNRMAHPPGPMDAAEFAERAAWTVAMGPAGFAFGPDIPKVGLEAGLRGSADLGQMGKDIVESQILDPLSVVRKAAQQEGLMNTAGKLLLNAPRIAGPGLTSTTSRLLQTFPTQTAEVMREALIRDKKQADEREALSKGDRSLLGEVATAVASMFTDDTTLAEEIGKSVSPPKDLAQATDLAAEVADPSVLQSRLVKVGSRIGNKVAPKLTARLSTPILSGGRAGKVAAAAEAKDRLSGIAANNRQAWDEAVLRGDPTAPPLQTPPIQLIPQSEAELAKALYGARAAEAGQQAQGGLQRITGGVGKVTEAGGKGVEALAGAVDDLADKYEGPLSAAATVAGAAKGPLGAVVGSQLPSAVRKAAKWGENASRAGTALRTIANTDWESSIPVWRQIAKDPNAPKWLVRGVTANVVGKLKAGEAVEKALRTGGDLGKGILEGAATDAVLTASDTSKSGEEIGGEAGVGGLLGGTATLPALKSMSNERKALAFAYDSMKKASESMANGADPLVVAGTPDATMHAAVILENTFRGMLPGRQDLKVDLMDAKQFAASSKDPNAAAYFDESTGRIAVNLESVDADGRQLHEVGHALMASVASSNPAIIQHYQQLLGPDGLARARQDYQQALGRTIPQDDAFIVGELFSESMANALRGVNLNEALPVVLGRTDTQSFFRDADVRKALKDPSTLELVRSQFQAASDFRPAVDMDKEPGVKLRPEQAGNHPALPTEVRTDGTQGNDFVDVVNGQPRETPVPVVRARVRSRRKEVLTLFPDVPPSRSTNPQASDIGLRQGPSLLTEKTGTRLGEQFYATSRTFGEGTKNMLRRLEQAIANNETMAGWYQQIGTGDGWSASVRESLGALEAQYKDFQPYAFKVDKQGNLLIQNYSLTALERKASDWAGRNGPLSLDLWNGDLTTFKQDVQTYLKNHAEGRPGADGIGENKRNLINVFLVGGNRTFEALNPLRAQAKGKDRQGIVRSYRADRLQTVEPSDVTGYEKPDYNKQVRNLSPRIERSVNDLDKLGNKDLPQVNAKTIKYPNNPAYPASIALPARWGLVNEKIVGMPKTSKEVSDIVVRQVDRLERVIQDMPDFAKESARFYLDMGLSSLDLASAALPGVEGLEQHKMADLMLRFLALGSPRTGVAANATKSSYSVSAAASDFTPGLKIGFGPQQRGAKEAMASWKKGQPFDLNMPGIDNKVRNFYLNGISEIIDLAEKNGDTASYEHLMNNVAGSLGITKPGETLSKDMYPEVKRLLDGMATVDMWDMAAKGFAWPGYLIDPAKRNDAKQPWQWSQDKFATETTMGSPEWKQILEELSKSEKRSVNGPEDLRYQQARALRIEGNKDWSEKTWQERLESGKPFGPETPITVFTEGSEAGLSPGGAGPLYDAQQSIDGLIADEINNRGLAQLFGKEKLLARNAQEILWALERLDNPVEANNELVLFGQTFKAVKDTLQANQLGEKVAPGNRGDAVLDAMDRAYESMASQDIPIEVVSAGSTPEAARIQNKIAELKNAGVPDADRVVTESVAAGMMGFFNEVAEKHGLKVVLDNVRTGLGGYSEGGYANKAPNMVLRLRGSIPDVRRVLEVMSRAMDQDGGNIFRRPTIRELNDPKTKLNNVLTFDTQGLTPEQQWAFFSDLNNLKDAAGNSFLTGFTQTGEGMAIGDQFYKGDMIAALDANKLKIAQVMRQHGVGGLRRERLIVDTFFRGTPAEKGYGKSGFVKDFTQRLQSQIESAAPAERQFPMAGDAKARIQRLTKDAVYARFDGKTEASRYFVDLASQVDVAILRDEITEEVGDAMKAEINRIAKRKIAQAAEKTAKAKAESAKAKEEAAKAKAARGTVQ